MKKQKKILLITVLGVITLIGVVYATFTVLRLSVNTTATVSASVFDVGFDDVTPTIEKSNENISVDVATPEEGADSIDITVNGLKKAGDSATIKLTVKNFGDVDSYVHFESNNENFVQDSTGYNGCNFYDSDAIICWDFKGEADSEDDDMSMGTGSNPYNSSVKVKSGEEITVTIEVSLLQIISEDMIFEGSFNLVLDPITTQVQ